MLITHRVLRSCAESKAKESRGEETGVKESRGEQRRGDGREGEGEEKERREGERRRERKNESECERESSSRATRIGRWSGGSRIAWPARQRAPHCGCARERDEWRSARAEWQRRTMRAPLISVRSIIDARAASEGASLRAAHYLSTISALPITAATTAARLLTLTADTTSASPFAALHSKPHGYRYIGDKTRFHSPDARISSPAASRELIESPGDVASNLHLTVTSPSTRTTYCSSNGFCSTLLDFLLPLFEKSPVIIITHTFLFLTRCLHVLYSYFFFSSYDKCPKCDSVCEIRKVARIGHIRTEQGQVAVAHSLSKCPTRSKSLFPLNILHSKIYPRTSCGPRG